jgi:hypothetical protein
MADDVVLSQADIDALLSNNSGPSITDKQSNSTSAEKQPLPKVTAASKSQIEQLKKEKAVSSTPPPSAPRLSPSKSSTQARSAPVANKAINQSGEIRILRATVTDLQKRLAKMEIAMAEAQQNRGPNINKMFHCDSCESHGLVAFSSKCTKCGKQTWWGWWPQK